MTTPLLSVSGLTVRYGAALALAEVDLEVPAGECLAVVGANGAGKSTLGKAVAGLVGHTGEVALDGSRLGGDRARQGVVYVPEGRMVFTQLTVADNLRAGAFVVRRQGDWRARRDRILERLPRLAERLGVRAGLLSGGEQQLLAIARALMAEPRVLLLDEPSLGLSPSAITTVTEFLDELRTESEVTLVILEQNAAFAARLANHGRTLRLGRLDPQALDRAQLAQLSTSE